jgi:tetratricopeptide (TPR) repeat protein
LWHARGDHDAALRYAIFAMHGDASPRILAQLGLCYIALQNFPKANDHLLRAVRAEPLDKASWNNLGIARRALGNLEGARAAFARALAIDANYEKARENARMLAAEMEAGVASKDRMKSGDGRSDAAIDPSLNAIRSLMQEGRAEEAQTLCEQASADAPDDPRYALELSNIYWTLDEPQASLDVLWAFHTRHPLDPVVRTRLASRLVRMGNRRAAEPLLDLALAHDGADVDALLAMGEVRFDKARYAEAGLLFERAYALRPTVDVQGQLMAAQLAQCRYADVLQAVDEMQIKDPSVAANVVTFRIEALTGLGRHQEVLPAIEEQLVVRPNHPGLRFSRASILLAREEYQRGWEDYAFRNVAESQYARTFQFQTWRGEPLEGKSILVAADQGVGDQVMFSSCIPDLLTLKPARVVVEVVHRIAKTIRRSFPGVEVIGSGQDRDMPWLVGQGHFDYCCLIADLPRYLRKDRASFPRHTGYLVADPDRRAHWRAKLHDSGPPNRPRIGFSWKGGTERTRTTLRTMDALEFLTLQDSIDATWVCLQYGDVQEPLARARDAGRPVTYWKEAVDDLDEFAALVSELDLVVTVCNTTVHFAGALGRPVVVLTPKIPEWRYGHSFRTMPWYPSSIVLRQPEAGRWSEVLTEAGHQLNQLLATNGDKECQSGPGLALA